MANKKVEPRLTPIMHAYLRDLVETGAYGDSPSDVARTLIEIGIRDALAKKLIAIRKTTAID
jgi:Arc/MetJ-type ribon-helix-helix transcriptional regulator